MSGQEQATDTNPESDSSVAGGSSDEHADLKDLTNISVDIQVSESPLGKETEYPQQYTPSVLHPMSRPDARDALGLLHVDQIRGEDVWTAYEFSWLNADGKPMVAGIRLHVPCQSEAIVESKSLKLYLNSFAQTRFDTRADVLTTLDKDLGLAFQAPVSVELIDLRQLGHPVDTLAGICLDQEDVLISQYTRNPELLQLSPDKVSVKERCFTDLFRSLCPVTGQPDWASLFIEYAGPAIDRGSLLKYLVSYRNHQAFHETTIEQIYCDLMEYCAPHELTVYGRFVRRGGIDINPFRSNVEDSAPELRLSRQ